MISLPFVLPFHTLPIPSFHSEWLASVLGCLGLMLIALRRDNPLWCMPGIAAAPVALMLVVLLQWAMGMFAYFATAFTLFIYLLWCALLAMAGQTLVSAVGKRALASKLAWFLYGGGLINALFGLLQYLGVSHAFGGLISTPLDLSVFGIYGNLGQENHFATHIALTLVSASYLCYSGQLALRWHGLSTLVCLLALALSGSRSSFLYIALLVTLSLWLARIGTENRNYKRMGCWIGGTLLALGMGLWFVVHFLPTTPQLERLVTFSSAVGPRVFLWRHALAMFVDNPVLGVGFDAFAYHLVGQLNPARDPTVWGIDQYAHNLILHLLAVSGLFGLLAVAGPGLVFLRRLTRVPFCAESFWSWGVLGILLIHSMLEQPLFYGYFLGLAALVAGMSDSKAWVITSDGKTRALFAAACAMALGLLLKTANDYDNIEGHFYSARYVNSNPEKQVVVESEVIKSLSRFSLFSPLAELIAPEHVVPATASASDRVAFNERVMRYAPVAEIEFRHAALLAADGRIPEANKQFARAAFAYPHDAKHYQGRTSALAETDSATYGPLADFANEWMGNRTHSDER